MHTLLNTKETGKSIENFNGNRNNENELIDIMKIYIDIDGVPLTKGQKIPKHGKEFLEFLTQNFNCYWFTTHCKSGENQSLNYLKKYYAEKSIEQFKKVKPSSWTT